MRTKLIIAALALSSHVLFGGDTVSFNDPLFNKQWAMKNDGQTILKNISDLQRIRVQGIPGSDINWIDTSSTETTKKELIVAVLDSGVDIDHPDLKGRIWYNEKLCKNAPNAKILACNGFNFLDGNNNVSDDVGHGTHVAGIIAANGHNATGVVGAADSRIKIMPIKVLNSQVSGFVYNNKLITDVIADAMVFAIKNGAEVINLSLGWPKLIDTPKIRNAFLMAEDQNVMVIAASGNNTKDLPTFPCSYESVVCVGATDNRGDLTDFSNFGSKVDVVAPGEYIVSTIPRTLESRVMRIANYDVKRGSSQAAPYVSAAVATLKLLQPGLSNDAVRSLLFRSVKQLDSKNAKTVKYGSLDMKKLLSLAGVAEEKAFVQPETKAITEIKFKKADKKFGFNLPLKNLSDTSFAGSVCLNPKHEGIAFDQSCFDVTDLKGHSKLALAVSGTINDLKADSHIDIEIKIDEKVFTMNLVLSRDLNGDADLQSFPVNGGNFDDMGIISGDRKLSRMVRVIDKFHRLNFPEYFFMERAKQSAGATVVSLLTKENNAFAIKAITLPLVNKVLSIHRQDINLDGKLDYFIYTLSAKKDELQFYLFDNNLNPLFGNKSRWSMPLSTFEGLPIDGGQERFEWLKVNQKELGSILVPAIFRSYSMPEADNSKKILERVTGPSFHQYFLNPVMEKDAVKIELRVVDSVERMKKMRSSFKLYDDQSIVIIRPFPQTDEESKKGIIHSLGAIDYNDHKDFIELELTTDGIAIKPLSTVIGLDGALLYPVIETSAGKLTRDAVLTSLLNRSNAEFLIRKDQTISEPLVLAQEWENPIIGLLQTFDTKGEKSFLIENRSSITFLKSDGTKADLPVYRDSSFPGQNFSETLMPVLITGNPGLFINSTLIYGERLYSMIASESGFNRPLALSIDIPNGCVPLFPETLEEKASANYAFLCVDQMKTVSLKFLPMSLD